MSEEFQKTVSSKQKIEKIMISIAWIIAVLVCVKSILYVFIHMFLASSKKLVVF